MLDSFKNEQPLFYEEVVNSIKNNKISHAYLIETNNYRKSDELILSFVKTIFCKKNNTDLTNCNTCNLCHLIDTNNLSDFNIIEPDGSFIKKDQILDIKEKFKTTSFQNNPRIYLIKCADRLNKQASNSLLKFLEEPDGNIIAMLETDNRYKVLPTIRSRCQVYTLLNNEKTFEFTDFDLLTKFIKNLETKKNLLIAYLPGILDNDYRNKDFWISFFNEMIHIYENAIRKKENIDYTNYGELLDFLVNNNSVSRMIYKIRVLFLTINNLDYNLNIPMMLDKFIIDFTNGGDTVECSRRNFK